MSTRTFGTPADLFIIPDHYVFRMLYSQGVPSRRWASRSADGGQAEGGHAADHRQIWQTFAEYFYLFRGTPSGVWLAHAVRDLRHPQKLTGATAQAIYDELADKLAQPAYRPRALFERFNIEVLCTTDGAADSLEHHQGDPGVRLGRRGAADLPARCGDEPGAAGVAGQSRCARRGRRPGDHHGPG